MRLLCSLVLGAFLASCGSGGNGIRRTIVTDPIVQGYEAAGYWESVDGTMSLTVELFGSFATAILATDIYAMSYTGTWNGYTLEFQGLTLYYDRAFDKLRGDTREYIRR